MTREPTEMELRVARAMYERSTVVPSWNQYLRDKKNWDKLQTSTRNKYLNDARAAIRALSHATTEMLREAGLNSSTTTEQMAEDFQAMIDAASPPDA